MKAIRRKDGRIAYAHALLERVLWPWAGCRREGHRRWRSVLFCYATEKYQKNAPKRGRTYGFAPLGDPPTPVGMLYGDVLTLAEVCIRRKDAFREAHCIRVHTRRKVH